jgi:DNA-binding transcriptional LysR family regulator
MIAPERTASGARLPELRRLAAFLVLAEELHFGRAAARLMMCSSPLSRIIIGLEQDLAVTLFRRNKRTVKLTEAGRRLLPKASYLVNYLDAAVVHVRDVEASTKTRKLPELRSIGRFRS